MQKKWVMFSACAMMVSSFALYAPKGFKPGWQPLPVKHDNYLGMQFGYGEGPLKDKGWSALINTGYRFNRNMAAEFVFLRTPRGKDPRSSLLFGMGAKLDWPITYVWYLDARAGGGAIFNQALSNSYTRIGLYYGVGTGVHVTRKIDLVASFMQTLGRNDIAMWAGQAGAVYRFG